jgi:AcrR family transcriptional regulator
LCKIVDVPRKYDMTRRAERVAQTQRRITEAAVELHGSVGPARTTITAIADRAGVDRLTVYRHFPDEDALFAACSSHWLAAHPYPDPARWGSSADPRERLTRALSDLYAWYRANHTMMENVLRDAAVVPSLGDRPERWAGYNRAVVETLVRGWSARGRRRDLLRAVIAHAVALDTWRSLTSNGLDDRDAGGLMLRLVEVTAR